MFTLDIYTWQNGAYILHKPIKSKINQQTECDFIMKDVFYGNNSVISQCQKTQSNEMLNQKQTSNEKA